MKKAILSLILLATLISCNTSAELTVDELDRISWSAFCKEFGYDEKADANNSKAINDYLDAWRGTVSEEEALAKQGITQCW